MSRRAFHLFIAVSALLAGAMAWIDAPVPVRVVPTLLLAVFLPGLALTEAVLPGTAIGRSERLLLSVGLSLAVVIASALVLNVTPFGLSRESFVVTLVTSTVVASLVAFLRTPARSVRWTQWRSGKRLEIYPVTLFGLGALLAIAAVLLATFAELNQPVARFTELWAIPRDDFQRIEVGIRNLERGPRTYRLEIRTSDRVVSEWAELTVAVGDTWTHSLDVAAMRPLEGDVTVRLYDSASVTQPYREVVVREAVLGGS